MGGIFRRTKNISIFKQGSKKLEQLKYLLRLRNPTTIMAYVVQLHNGIYSRSAVQYLERIASSVLDRSKPIILIAHQFTGESIMAFNETIRQLNVSQNKMTPN